MRNPLAPHADERPRCQFLHRLPLVFDGRKGIPPDRAFAWPPPTPNGRTNKFPLSRWQECRSRPNWIWNRIIQRRAAAVLSPTSALDFSRQQREARRSPHRWRLSKDAAVGKAVGPVLVEADHPVSKRLAVHPANLGRLCPRGTIEHRSDRQQPTRLTDIPRPLCKPTDLARSTLRVAALNYSVRRL